MENTTNDTLGSEPVHSDASAQGEDESLREGASNGLSPIQEERADSEHGDRSPTRLGGTNAAEKRAYTSWRNAKQRCRNPRSRGYEHYGGRGIHFSSAWDAFDDFLADMGVPPEGHTLDRTDPNGDYEPGNCRWAAPRIQARNRRSNRIVKHGDAQVTVADLVEQTGIPAKTLAARKARGWSDNQVTGTPYRPRPKGYRPTSEEKQMVTVDEAAEQAFTVAGLEEIWKRAHAESLPAQFVRPWRGQELRQMEYLLKDVPMKHAGRILLTAVRNWVEFTLIAADYGAFGTPPEFPTIGFATRNLSALVNFYVAKNRPGDLPEGASFDEILDAIDKATVAVTGDGDSMSPVSIGSNGADIAPHEEG